MRVKDKAAIITGGAAGIGRETAILLAKEGARIIIGDYHGDQAERTAEEIRKMGFDCLSFSVDVRQEAEVAAFMEKAMEKHGRIDILFNNAGIGTRVGAEDCTEEEWDQVVDTNLKGVFLCSKHVIPYMRKSGGGSIINCASILGYVANPDACAYNAAKGGVVVLTKHLAATYAKDNIRANTVCPSFIRTAMLDGLNEEVYTYLSQLHPLGRLANPLEVAYCVLFLASDESSYVTGSSLMVDGGFTAV